MPSDEEVTQRAGSLRSMMGLTEAECTAQLPYVEQALAASLQDRTMDGLPRTSRRYHTYDHGPVPTITATRLFILTYVQQPSIQAVPGQLFEMSPSHARQWIHRRHPALNHALADQELLWCHLSPKNSTS